MTLVKNLESEPREEFAVLEGTDLGIFFDNLLDFEKSADKNFPDNVNEEKILIEEDFIKGGVFQEIDQPTDLFLTKTKYTSLWSKKTQPFKGNMCLVKPESIFTAKWNDFFDTTYITKWEDTHLASNVFLFGDGKVKFPLVSLSVPETWESPSLEVLSLSWRKTPFTSLFSLWEKISKTSFCYKDKILHPLPFNFTGGDKSFFLLNILRNPITLSELASLNETIFLATSVKKKIPREDIIKYCLTEKDFSEKKDKFFYQKRVSGIISLFELEEDYIDILNKYNILCNLEKCLDLLEEDECENKSVCELWRDKPDSFSPQKTEIIVDGISGSIFIDKNLYEKFFGLDLYQKSCFRLREYSKKAGLGKNKTIGSEEYLNKSIFFLSQRFLTTKKREFFVKKIIEEQNCVEKESAIIRCVYNVFKGLHSEVEFFKLKNEDILLKKYPWEVFVEMAPEDKSIKIIDRFLEEKYIRTLDYIQETLLEKIGYGKNCRIKENCNSFLTLREGKEIKRISLADPLISSFFLLKRKR